MAGLDDAASELESIARHLREIGEGELVRDLQTAIRRAVNPVRQEIRAGLRTHMPKRYAGVLDADLAIQVGVNTRSRNPGVTLRATTRGAVERRRLRRLDRGLLAHPLFGDRERWYYQELPSVRPGWFSGPAEDDDPRVRAAIEQVLADASVKATSKGP